jgi:hypothetical protein
MPLNEFTNPTLDGYGDQTSLPFASSLIDSGTIKPDEDLSMLVSSDADGLPEKFQSVSLPDAAIRPGEADNTFVREQPW